MIYTEKTIQNEAEQLSANLWLPSHANFVYRMLIQYFKDSYQDKQIGIKIKDNEPLYLQFKKILKPMQIRNAKDSKNVKHPLLGCLLFTQ